MEQPLVTIIIPTYNRGHYLGETLDSVINQTYLNWECLVVDDGSKDYTEELMGFYCEIEPRIHFFSRPENSLKGANTCRNYGLELSKGNYIQWLDSDDIILENKLEAQIKLLENSEARLITCKWGKIKDLEKNFLFENLASYQNFDSPVDFLNSLKQSEGYFPIHAYLMDSNLVKIVGRWKEGLSVNQDGEFMMRILSNVSKITFCKNTAVYYRRSEDNSVSQIDEHKFENLIESWELIEQTLNQAFPQKGISYLDDVKKRIFIKYRGNRKFIKSHQEFFGDIPKQQPSDFKLNFYRLIIHYRVTRVTFRFLKNLSRGKLSIKPAK